MQDATEDDATEAGRNREPSSLSSGGAEARPFAALVLVSTPLGNLGDFPARAVETLAQVDAVLCEDTRTSAALLRTFGIKTKTIPLHDHNEEAATPRLIEEMRGGARYALISDAGTPVVSDPGFRLVRAAIAAGLDVSAVPGPNAAVMALTLSGLPPLPFMVLGFLPARDGARRAEMARLRALEAAGLSASLVFYEAPHRVAEFLADAAACFGDRPAAVARELSKRFEEVRRGGLAALAAHYAATAARGEVTIVLGPGAAEAVSEAGLDAALAAALQSMSVKDAVAAVAAATGVARKTVYARALARPDPGRS
jgi:16S rRNA (cytidine1402-2'-O)-methyltransferase